MTEKKLPIAPFEDVVMGCEAPYIIVEGDTGSGKTTEVVRWFRKRGKKVLISEPLIETVVGTSEYVAELEGVELGTEVGYRTAHERKDSPHSEILFCTDGLALVRELAGHNRFKVLIIDEFHQENINQSTLEAWAWKHVAAGDSDFDKIIVMSASMNSAELSRKRGNAPVFKIPGRQFLIFDRAPGPSIAHDVRMLVSEGFDVLVFRPGKQEIADTISELSSGDGIPAELFPFHGQLERDEKKRAYIAYRQPKVVVSTNALETGRTLLPSPGRKLAVIDCGMERRIEVEDGVECLKLKPISKAQSKQRRGRTGRVGDGVYINHCQHEQPEYPVPEIMRTRLDQTVLRLAVVGYDMEELEFFHQPDKSAIHDARETLIGLGCLRRNGDVTRIGRLVNRLPYAGQYARMLVEADRLGVVDDVLSVAAIMEMGGITVPPPSRNNPDRPDWRHMVPSERESDVMGQLAVYRLAECMTKDEMRERGVSIRSYFRAKEIRKQLTRALERHFKLDSTGKREDILKAVCAGMVDHLYRGRYGRYQNGDSERELGSASCVSGAEWLVGKPFDLQVKTRRGMTTLRLIELASKVDPAWLTEVAPHLVETKTGLAPRFDAAKESVVSITQTLFNGSVVREDLVLDPKHPEATRILVEHTYSSFTRPELPRVNVDEATVAPSVQECMVGKHPETGAALIFFGTYRLGWYGAEAMWVRECGEAEQVREKFVADMARRREEACNRRAEEERDRATEAERTRIRAEEVARQAAGAEAARIAAETEAARRAEAERVAMAAREKKRRDEELRKIADSSPFGKLAQLLK